MSYGIFLGRCQPFHMGHEHAIHEIIRDGLQPIVALGTTQYEDRDERNPYSAWERECMIRAVFPGVFCVTVHDVPGDDEAWWAGVRSKLKWYTNRTFYTFTKWRDRDMGIFFESKGETVKRYVPTQDIDATKIRADLEGMKQALDGRVYNMLKCWGRL